MPTLKENQRYLVFELKNIDQNFVLNKAVYDNILKQCNDMLGIFEAAKAGLMPVKFNEKRGIIRVNNKYVDKLKVCLGLIKINNGINNTIIDCVLVSGMLNKAESML